MVIIMPNTLYVCVGSTFKRVCNTKIIKIHIYFIVYMSSALITMNETEKKVSAWSLHQYYFYYNFV